MIPTIPGRERIGRVMRVGSKKRGKFLAVRFMPNMTDHLRFAIIASKRVSSVAPERNRARRRVREVIRLNLHKLGGRTLTRFPSESRGCYDVVILLSPDCIRAPFQELETDLLNLLS